MIFSLGQLKLFSHTIRYYATWFDDECKV